ncbi:hypothetical protein F0562_035572 [Nyssa sinensis]|uniref:Hepatoma-derived growth factor-related protein 2-like n=1 Tax=Nyssa sinensis TaxID=561372 RepID=A0A5J5AFE1_9ASTE|nr:hypothetical protein F0562_035572 [Nyssa sinensis]
MADFSFLSDSDESAVEELLSQAMDHSVLEQVAAINCSGFTSDSVLPTQLETRFQRLKSFPVTKPKSPYLGTGNNSASSLKPHFENDLKNLGGTKTDSENVFLSPTKENPVEKKGLKSESQSRSVSSPSKSSNSSTGDAIFSPMKENPDGKKGLKSKSRSGSFLSPSNSSNLSMESLSPPRKTGCFWCSPKKDSRKKSNGNRFAGIDRDWGKKDEFLSDLDLGSFSTKEQQKMLKKAIKEEEKISREAEKIVKWAKQASARMDVSGIEDELSKKNITGSQFTIPAEF